MFATFAEFASLKTLSMSINIMAAVTDVVISLCLVYLLRLSANRSGFKRTNDMINRMIVFTFNTGTYRLCLASTSPGLSSLMPPVFSFRPAN